MEWTLYNCLFLPMSYAVLHYSFARVSSVVYQSLHLIQLKKQTDLMFLNIYEREKVTFWKPVGNVNSLERKFEEIH